MKWSIIKRKIVYKCVKPIRVFCFHQVSDVFEPETMWKCDWTQTDVFKRNIITLKKKYTFISLQDVTAHLKHDRFRSKRYACLTADDGWSSLKNILPWLAEQKIPITLFLNPLYLDGIHHQGRSTEKLLTRDDVLELVDSCSPYITIASHGWSHKDCLEMTDDVFLENVTKAEKAIETMDGKVPYYAFTYGRKRLTQVDILNNKGLVPVFMDGQENRMDDSCIHRQLFDSGIMII